MMKLFGICIFILLLAGGELSTSQEKKMLRTVKKSFDSENILLETVAVEMDLDRRHGPGLILFKLTEGIELRGYLCVTTAMGRQEYFDYMVIFNPDHSIRQVEILEYRSEHGYEIANKQWLRQFEGLTGCGLTYGNDIDAISGATYSASSITQDIGILCQLLKDQSDKGIIQKKGAEAPFLIILPLKLIQ